MTKLTAKYSDSVEQLLSTLRDADSLLRHSQHLQKQQAEIGKRIKFHLHSLSSQIASTAEE